MRHLLSVCPRAHSAAVLAALVLAAVAASSAGAQTKAPCSSFGTQWAHTYNLTAVRQQNPIRILGACCTPTKQSKVSSCLLTVGEVGIREHGCERVDLNGAGAVVSEGKHAACP